jgi:hypothetical protein
MEQQEAVRPDLAIPACSREVASLPCMVLPKIQDRQFAVTRGFEF